MKTLCTRDVWQAAALLRAGALVAFPTETVYGLGADATSAEAVMAIFAAKGRPADNPLIVHVAEPAALGAVAEVNPLAAGLVARFWPGPLTVVLPARPLVAPAARAGLPTVGVRCPDHALARELLRACGRPLAAPSANRSGRPSPTSAEAVMEELDGRIAAVLDGGPCRLGVESTVVDCTGAAARILRLGALPAEVLGLRPCSDPAATARSPGTRHRHYAPAVPLHLVADLAASLRRWPAAAVLCRQEEAAWLGLVPGEAAALWPETAEGRAAVLFSTLRRLEKSGRPAIVVTSLPDTGLDAATMDRLRRAAAAGQEESPAPGGSLA